MTGPHAFSSVHNESSLSLARFLRSKGWDFVDSPADAEVICAVEIPVTSFHLPKVSSNSKHRGLALVQEPSVVRPFHRREFYEKRFARFIELGRAGEHGHPWPALYLNKFFDFSKKPKLPRACLIASNKMSLIDGELYSLRRAVVQSSPLIDLYGQGWDAGKIVKLKQACFEIYNCFIALQIPKPKRIAQFMSDSPSNLGPIGDKLVVNSKYKVSIVIENSAEFMSEKLLEALSAGSIPVYVGPSPVDFGIPEDLVIHVEPNLEAIQDGICKALEMDFETWAEACANWISAVDPNAWSLEGYWEKVHQELLALRLNVIGSVGS